MVNFPTRIPDCDSHSPALLDLFIFSDTSICSTMAFPRLGNPMEHLSNDHEDHLYQHKNSHKLCNETRHPVVNLIKSQLKLRQQHDQNPPMEGKPLQNKY